MKTTTELIQLMTAVVLLIDAFMREVLLCAGG